MAVKELKESVSVTFTAVVRHYTMVAVSQQAGEFAVAPKYVVHFGSRWFEILTTAFGFRPNEQVVLDPLVMIDALAVIMGHEEKERCQQGIEAMTIMLETATTLLGTKDLVSFALFFLLAMLRHIDFKS